MKIAFYSSLFVLVATGVLANDIAVDSTITAVTVYPQGAMITRAVSFDTTPGNHRVLVRDMPDYFDFSSMRISGTGDFTLGTFEMRDDNLPPGAPVETAESRLIQARIDHLEAAIIAKDYEVEGASLRQRAADAQLNFINAIGQAKAAEQLQSTSADDLRAIATMIGQESLVALRQAHQARIDATALRTESNDLRQDLNAARQELAALLLPQDDSPQLSVQIDAAAAGAGMIYVSYMIDAASWSPLYDISLTQGETPALQIERSIQVSQQSGDTWTDIALTVSTARPNAQSAPSAIYPLIARYDPPVAFDSVIDSASVSGMMLAAPMARLQEEAPMPAARSAATASYQGQTVIYHMPDTVTIAGDGAAVQLALDTKDTIPVLSALAVATADNTAFVMAHITNDSGEILLPGAARLFRDGAMIGTAQLPLTAEGTALDLPFGAIEGLQISRRVLAREEGDTGVFTSANRRGEQFEITAENLTGRQYDLRIMDRIPISEQEDLTINPQSNPRFSETNVDGRRGIVAWDLALGVGQKQAIRFGYEINWPTDMELYLRDSPN